MLEDSAALEDNAVVVDIVLDKCRIRPRIYPFWAVNLTLSALIANSEQFRELTSSWVRSGSLRTTRMTNLQTGTTLTVREYTL